MTLASQPTITGNLFSLDNFSSPELENERDIFIYLPPSYHEEERRYPVVYMHDAQNLFDENMSFSGEWQVDETMEALALQGVEAIVVGITNQGEQRLGECCPFPSEEVSHRGELYVEFIVKTLKPHIDGLLHTLPDRQHTGIMGSSMGGLITLYAFFRYPEVFGFAGAMSPSCWFANRALFRYVKEAEFVPNHKLYLDVGTSEGEEELKDVRHMRDLLFEKGFTAGQDFLYFEDEGALHTEAAWAYRLQVALRFLLPRAGVAGAEG